MGFLLRFLGRLRWRMALALALSFLTVASGFGLMATSAYLISRAALHPATILVLLVPIVGVRFFGIARAVFRYLERLAAHDVTFRMLAGIRVWLYERLDAEPPLLAGARRRGDLLSRLLGDVDVLQDFFLRALTPPVVLVLTALLVTGVLWHLSPVLAAALGGALLLGGSVPGALQHRIGRQRGAQLQSARAEFSAQLAEGLRGAGELMALGQAEAYFAALDAAQGEALRAQVRLRRASAGAAAVVLLFSGASAVLALVVGIPLLRAGLLPGPDLAVAALGILAAFEAAVPMPQALQSLGTCRAASGRIAEAGAPAATRVRPGRPRGCDIAIERVGVRYPGEAGWALRDITLHLPRGRHVAIVGASGAGKSTLLSLILGLAPYEEGSVRLGGAEVDGVPRDLLYERAAVIRQTTDLFRASLRDNLRLGRPDAGTEEILRACGAAQLTEVLRGLPQGLDTMLGEQGATLSGGERQRVAVARALVRDVPILLLDEPTRGLDAVTQAAVWDALERIGAGRTVVCATHRLQGLERMDEIVVLQEGRIVERGTHAQLLARGAAYDRMWHTQRDHIA